MELSQQKGWQFNHLSTGPEWLYFKIIIAIERIIHTFKRYGCPFLCVICFLDNFHKSYIKLNIYFYRRISNKLITFNCDCVYQSYLRKEEEHTQRHTNICIHTSPSMAEPRHIVVRKKLFVQTNIILLVPETVRKVG